MTEISIILQRGIINIISWFYKFFITANTIHTRKLDLFFRFCGERSVLTNDENYSDGEICKYNAILNEITILYGREVKKK